MRVQYILLGLIVSTSSCLLMAFEEQYLICDTAPQALQMNVDSLNVDGLINKKNEQEDDWLFCLRNTLLVGATFYAHVQLLANGLPSNLQQFNLHFSLPFVCCCCGGLAVQCCRECKRRRDDQAMQKMLIENMRKWDQPHQNAFIKSLVKKNHLSGARHRCFTNASLRVCRRLINNESIHPHEE
jgi:hypothetical protein